MCDRGVQVVIRRDWELTPCQKQPITAGSKPYPPLAKIWAHQQLQCSLCDNIFRKGQKMLESCCDRERYKENEAGPNTSRWEKEEGEEVLQAREQRFPYNSWTGGGQGVYQKLTEGSYWRKYHTASSEETLLEQVDMPWRKVQPMEIPYRSKLLAGTAVNGAEPTQSFSGMICSLWGTSAAASRSWRTASHGKDSIFN